jgi:hypothetical protein
MGPHEAGGAREQTGQTQRQNCGGSRMIMICALARVLNGFYAQSRELSKALEESAFVRHQMWLWSKRKLQKINKGRAGNRTQVERNPSDQNRTC